MKKFAFALFLFLSSYGFTESLEYVVERKGKEIGTHTFIFSKSDEGMNVQILTNIVVKLGFIPVYKFIHDGLETWTNGVLIGYDSTTNDNGADKIWKSSIRLRSNKKFKVAANQFLVLMLKFIAKN